MLSAISRRLLFGFALLTILAICSCGSRDTPPVTRGRIFEDRLKVDTLYLTEDGREIIAPGNRAEVIVHPETNELAWAAWQCDNPDCPGEGKGGRPFLFICPNPFAFVQGDGSVGFRQPQNEKDFELLKQYAERTCPACLKTRNKEAETAEQQQQYEQWCRRYVLPESAEKLQQLEEQLRRHHEELDRRRKRKPRNK